MRTEWKASKFKMGSLACIENLINGELALSGRYGEIWQYSSSEFRAVIYSHRISKRYLPRHRWPIKPQDETLIRFSTPDLILWVERLRVPAKASTQAEISNQRSLGLVPNSIVKEVKVNIESSESVTGGEARGLAPTPSTTGLRIGSCGGTENLTLAKTLEGS
jgi:hypothetical protein